MVRRLTLKRYNVKLASHEKSPAGGCLLDSRGPGVAEIVESLRRRPRLVPKSRILPEFEEGVRARGVPLSPPRENLPAGIAVGRRHAVDNGGRIARDFRDRALKRRAVFRIVDERHGVALRA